jgi:hypothetical protein
MADGMTDNQANKVLNQIFGSAANTPPATWYLALFTSAPGETGGGTECTGGAYARLAVTNNTTNFPTTTNGVKNLGVTASFTEATGNWGTIVAVGLFEASTGGLLQWYGPVTPQVIAIGDTCKIPAGTTGLNLTLT